MELVTGAMGSLLPKLAELLKEEYKLHKGVREQVKSLERELEIMHAALRKVAEVPHEQLDDLVKLWARDVRELSYDMEDVIDTFLVRVEDGREATPNLNMLKRPIEKMVKLFSQGKARRQIADAIKDINNQLQQLASRHGRYTVNNIMATPAATSTIDPRLLAMYKAATQLVGIDGPRDALIEMLSEGDDASNKKTKIVSIIGIGGLGKTTLAKAVYDKVKTGFNCWAFVPVGQNPNMKKVLRDILIGFDKQYANLNMTMLDEKQLIDELREFLKDKRSRPSLRPLPKIFLRQTLPPPPALPPSDPRLWPMRATRRRPGATGRSRTGSGVQVARRPAGQGTLPAGRERATSPQPGGRSRGQRAQACQNE